MLNMKKIFIVAGILTALGASAFAAEAADEAAQAQKPSMRERVEAILHEDGSAPAEQKEFRHGPHHGKHDGKHFGGPHHGRHDGKHFGGPHDRGPEGEHLDKGHNCHRPPMPPHMSEAERAKFDQEREQRRAEWEKMTPEQREEAHKKFQEEHEKRRAEWEKMTPEQREEAHKKFEQEREQRRAEWEKMTPEQREEAHKKFEQEHGKHHPGMHRGFHGEKGERPTPPPQPEANK